MRICFLLPGLARSGGVGVALDHARSLVAEEGADVDVVLTGPGDAPAEAPAGTRLRPLAEAAGERYDIAISTWWATAPALFSIPAERRIAFLQSFEHRFYPEWDLFDRMGAGTAWALPVDFVVVAEWMRDVLAELRPDARCRVVANGIDKETFSARGSTPAGPPLRVLVEGQPDLWFKGVEQALAATRAMEEPVEVTVVALDPSSAGELGADRVVGGLSAAGMAELYAEHHVMLKLSRVEGLPLPPLEAFHVGVPCVVAPFTGHEEYMRHGHNGIVVGFDDIESTARWLDLLARDRPLLERLGGGALETAEAWPDRSSSNRIFADAIRVLAAEPPPAVDDAMPALLDEIQLTMALGRHRAQSAGWDEAELARAQAQVAEYGEHLRDLEARLDRITGSPPYRALNAGRRAVERLRR